MLDCNPAHPGINPQDGGNLGVALSPPWARSVAGSGRAPVSFAERT